jgi:lipopolysaccharide/colanic/teichoic acid biosynthesis glycosyltransferase
MVTAIAFLVIRIVAGHNAAPLDFFFTSLLIFSITDLLLSMPRRRQHVQQSQQSGMPAAGVSATSERSDSAQALHALDSVDTVGIQEAIAGKLDTQWRDFLRDHLPQSDEGIDTWLIIDDRPESDEQGGENEDIGLLIGHRSLNEVTRLNLYLKYCAMRLAMGGYFVVRYTPLDVVTRRLHERYRGIRLRLALLNHFIWYRAIPKLPWLDRLYFSPLFAWIDRYFLRNSKLRIRVLAMAEVWGRLAYYGMEVVAESDGDERLVLARRVTAPISDRRPSYYAVVALEKVGLDGERIFLHKVRSMYPFSEFLQKRIFESHGLSEIGKFRDDPRLTDYGSLLRKHWIDELPGLYDWLRGDVKLVGMRATSPHFLSLYPRALYDLYVQTKPGLVPPIFDESTDGFDDIVRTEMTYLERYQEAPIKTDIQYFWYTVRDIVFRKVRSR